MVLTDIFQFAGIWPAGLTLLALGFVFALVLLIASEKLKVQLDPKVEQIYEALPQIDCGACGFAGCSQYAKAVSQDGELLGRCAPGGAKAAEKIAQVLNLQISGSGFAQRPIIHCRAHTAEKTYYAIYEGIRSCTSANAYPTVQACKFGCLEFGDCVEACKFDALHIIDGLATVDYEKCTGCGACAKACPRNLIEMVPFSSENMMTVACSRKETGKVTRQMCRVGCIACTMRNTHPANKPKPPWTNVRPLQSCTAESPSRLSDSPEKNRHQKPQPANPNEPRITNNSKLNICVRAGAFNNLKLWPRQNQYRFGSRRFFNQNQPLLWPHNADRGC